MDQTDDTTGDAGDPAQEFMDPYHQRASIHEDGRMLVRPDKVFDNLADAMERMDLDINAMVAMEDAADVDELLVMIETLGMGPALAVHVVNTAMQIMAARYPAELVRRPLPPEYDLGKIVPVVIAERPHDTAKAIFNRRTASAGDLEPKDVADDLAELPVDDQILVITALFFMYGTKIGALKYTTGIE
jgi:hypothetical protein